MSLSIEQMNERDKILFGTGFNMQNYPGGIRYFSIPLDKVDLLIDKGYLNPDSRKNNSPTVAQFLSFCREHESEYEGQWFLHGFAESPARADAQIIIEGVQGLDKPMSAELRDKFLEFFSIADELSGSLVEPPWCWYD